jgi:hypothetical protein
MIAALVWSARRLGWTGPVDIASVFDGMFGLGKNADESHAPVNVDLQDASGAAMDLGTFVETTMQNGRGNRYKLYEGKFEGCNPNWIKAGAQVDVSYQHGQIKERLAVQIDYKQQRLFIQSKYRLDEVLAVINGCAETGHRVA